MARARKIRSKGTYTGTYDFDAALGDKGEESPTETVRTGTTMPASKAINHETDPEADGLKSCIRNKVKAGTVKFCDTIEISRYGSQDSIDSGWWGQNEVDVIEGTIADFEDPSRAKLSEKNIYPPNLENKWVTSRKLRFPDRYGGWKTQVLAWFRASVTAKVLDEAEEWESNRSIGG